MSGLSSGVNISVALGIAPLALWPVLPLLMLCYVRLLLLTRRMRPAFALGKSEEEELERSAKLLDRIRGRLKSLTERTPHRKGILRVLHTLAAHDNSPQADEVDDLRAYAEHMQAVVLLLMHRPLHRLRRWIQCRSLRSACGAAVALHVLVLALLMVLFQTSDQPLWRHEMMSIGTGLGWSPVNERFFDANALAVGITGIIAPLFYLSRRAALGRDYSLELTFFNEFANGDPASLLPRSGWNDAVDAADGRTSANWTAILGLSEAATVQEVKQAYKTLIRQSHPDRLQDMSPTLKSLAEAETKKINAAYRQALLSIQAS
jgi:DnaJ-domain-containing protein 1